MTATLPHRPATDTVPNLVGVAIKARDLNWSNGKILTEVEKVLNPAEPEVPSQPRTPADRATLTRIFDCAANAWDEVGATGLGDFGRLYREDLDDAGRELIRPLLIAGWRKRGYRVRLLDANSINRMSVDPNVDPPDETYWEVWQEAVDQIDYDALLTAADLTAEYDAYREDES